MAQTITNNEKMRKLLEENGWEQSVIFHSLYSKDDKYFEIMNKDNCAYGIGESIRCEMDYPICVVDNYEPCEMVWHKTIKQNGITIRLDE